MNDEQEIRFQKREEGQLIYIASATRDRSKMTLSANLTSYSLPPPWVSPPNTSLKAPPISFNISCVTTLLPSFSNARRDVVRVTMLPPMAANIGIRDTGIELSPKAPVS